MIENTPDKLARRSFVKEGGSALGGIALTSILGGGGRTSPKLARPSRPTGSLNSSSGVRWRSWNEQGISFVASPRICLHGKRQVYRLSWADDDSRYWLFFRASQHAVDDSGFWTAHQRIPFFGNRSGGGIGATLGRSGHCGRRRDHSAGPKGGGSDPRGLLRVHERSEAICRTSRRGVSGAPKTPQTAALGRYWTRPLAGENPPRFARFKSH